MLRNLTWVFWSLVVLRERSQQLMTMVLLRIVVLGSVSRMCELCTTKAVAGLFVPLWLP